jgi:Sel1 repeat
VAGCGKTSREAAKARRGLLWQVAHLIIIEVSILGQIMNSFYWTQSLLVIVVAILAFFISFGPSQNRVKWITGLGITASVALFVANQVVMNKTGKDLDWQLNCWLSPSGVDCPKSINTAVQMAPPDQQITVSPAEIPTVLTTTPAVSATEYAEQALTEYNLKNYTKARELHKQACAGGVARSCNRLAMMWANGKGGDQDSEIACALVKQACDGGDALGCVNSGLYAEGDACAPPNQERALEFFKRACDAGNADGCQELDKHNAR